MSPDPALQGFVFGALTLGWLVIALLFLRFWRRHGDPLFASFAAAFVLLAANQAAPLLLGVSREDGGGIYLLRLCAFVLIIFAVLRKNLKGSPG